MIIGGILKIYGRQYILWKDSVAVVGVRGGQQRQPVWLSSTTKMSAKRQLQEQFQYDNGTQQMKPSAGIFIVIVIGISIFITVVIIINSINNININIMKREQEHPQ